LTYRIGLTVEEARKVEELLGRAPTLTEAVIWGIQGSEHCSYKSSRRFLKAFPTSGRHVILGPKEDSGIVAITDGPPGKRWGLVISHESHNHPSQIVPFEGAATGVGGTVRDVACMGARVIGCMDMLRLGDLRSPETREIAMEVARGIAGYGNPLGIPNLGGDTVFDSSFNNNCLVNAIAVGIVREDEIIHSFVPDDAGSIGYDIILVGKPTDRSGFGGAAFASVSMEQDKREQNAGAVQEPNPFLERHLLASTYALFDWLAAEGHLDKISFKDLGAGGVVCASVEQVASKKLGAIVDLDKVHVSVADLPPEVIACAETQERFCWMCHPSLTTHILHHYNDLWALPSVAEHAGASVIGKVTADDRFKLLYRGVVVCDASSEAITSGLQYVRPTKRVEIIHPEPMISMDQEKITVTADNRVFHTSIKEVIEAMLSHPNHASKDPFILHFDKTVIGNGIIEAGEADASVIAPLQDLKSYVQGGTHPGWELSVDDQKTGVALAADGNPRYGRISAYWQGANAAIESMYNVAACGAEPRALTDCLNYGNPEKPEHLAELEDGVQGIADACNGIRIANEPVPVISGNVSLYNSLPEGSAIPPSAIVCCIGVLKDATKAVSMQLQQTDSTLFLLGDIKNECGGSAYYEILEQLMRLPKDALLGNDLPKPVFSSILAHITFLQAAVDKGYLLSSHDISDGGLLLALLEMTLPQRKLGGNIGIQIDLHALQSPLRCDTLLFSQSPNCILEVSPQKKAELMELATKCKVPLTAIGQTSSQSQVNILCDTQTILSTSLTDIHSRWKTGLQDALLHKA